MTEFARSLSRQIATRDSEMSKISGATEDSSYLQSLFTIEDHISLGIGAIDRYPVYGDPISGQRKRRRSYSHSHGDKDRERPVEVSHSISANSKKRRPNSPSSRIKDSERRGDERPSSSVSDSSAEKSDDPSSGIRPASVPSMNSSEGTASVEEKVVSYKDTLKGNEKELYLRVERCVDTKMYQDGAWETNVTSIWEEEAAKLQAEKEGVVAKLASPNITANMTEVRKVPLKKQVTSLERRQVRARESLMSVCKAHIKEWYKLEGLSPDDLAKRVNFLLDEERFQSPEDHYDDSKGHPSFRFHAIQLRKLTVERFFAKPQASGRKNPTLAKIYAYGKAPCLYAATIHQCLKAWKNGSLNKSIKNTKAVMNEVLQMQLATWNNLPENYRDNVCRGLEQNMLETVPGEKRPKTLIQPRREPTDCADLD